MVNAVSDSSICGPAADVLRRHERTHHDQTNGPLAASPEKLADSVMPTPDSTIESMSQPCGITSPERNMNARPFTIPDITGLNQPNGVNFTPQAAIVEHDALPRNTYTLSDSGAWFLENDFDVGALDLSISSAISEWAQLPLVSADPNLSPREQQIPTPIQRSDATKADQTHPTTENDHRPARDYLPALSDFPGQTGANELYREGLSQKLRPRVEDEALPSSEQLNLFAKLYFHRFHPLLPVIHAASFRPTSENSLLFLSICSIGSLFAGSPRAVMQGSRIFERLNKAILASWESFLSQGRPDALSMVQAAILGQTYAILAGNPKYLILADVLHGTVSAWAREANRLGSIRQFSHNITDDIDLDQRWHQWIDNEQRARVQVALNLHDAELAILLHHQPIRSHKYRQQPSLAPDSLFSATTESDWAALHQQYLQTQSESSLYSRVPRSPDSLPDRGRACHFTAYGLLESINSRLVDAKQSLEFDYIICQDISNHLIDWWRIYHTSHQESFCLPVLWHSIFIALYADLDLLEQAVGRDSHALMTEAAGPVHEWASTLNASRCLVHASLIARYLEQMSISDEPAIHVPRALFSAALTYLCVARYAPNHIISAEVLASPEIKILGDEAWKNQHISKYSQSDDGSVVADFDDVYRLIDLLQRGGRWGISQAFASVLSTALEEGKDSSVYK
ncbi:hypothetical protein N7456_000227 [Penicillium angulare]|uniref:Xylanolytic transcriptional activator regulatory domain-containing protein n=1 Tax=Penicillium angulare TaxID=116970 RepID=A0A9W9KS14_9EURO|nr:hypothetical protein N7456_000227 [Penicillium angulare]